jgi:uncharacterized membrane protein
MVQTTNHQQCRENREELKRVLMGTLTAIEDILLGILLGLSLFSVSYVIELGPHSRKKKLIIIVTIWIFYFGSFTGSTSLDTQGEDMENIEGGNTKDLLW